MAQFDPTIEVRIQGEDDPIFSILSLAHQLREGDVFQYEVSGEGLVTYKVENAVLSLVHSPSSNPETDTLHYDNPKLLVEVSVVP